jgi:hypothetical protein
MPSLWALILHVSVAPLGLELVLRFLPGVPFGHPGWLTSLRST